MRVPPHTLEVLWARQWGPGLTEVGRRIEVRCHVAKRMPVKGDVGRTWGKRACLYPAHPGVFGHTRHVCYEVVPMLSPIARQLQIAVVGSHPDEARGERRFADRVDGGMHLGRGIVDGHAARLLLLLLLRIVGSEVRGDPLPGLAVIP